jgi:hypothetical protein
VVLNDVCLYVVKRQLGYIKQILYSVQNLYVRYCANLLLLYQTLKNSMHSGFSFISFCNFYESLTDTEMNLKKFRGLCTEQ